MGKVLEDHTQLQGGTQEVNVPFTMWFLSSLPLYLTGKLYVLQVFGICFK